MIFFFFLAKRNMLKFLYNNDDNMSVFGYLFALRVVQVHIGRHRENMISIFQLFKFNFKNVI